jgi:hypothetical protein
VTRGVSRQFIACEVQVQSQVNARVCLKDRLSPQQVSVIQKMEVVSYLEALVQIYYRARCE